MIALAEDVQSAPDSQLMKLDDHSQLRGDFIQGGILFGTTLPGTQVSLDDESIMVSDKGDFVIGFGRDSELQAWLELTYANQQPVRMPLTLQAREYDIQYIDGLPPSQVTPPDSVLQRIRDDSRQVGEARSARLERTDFLQTFILPTEGRVSGVYGSQRVLNGEPRRPHFGIDIAAATGTEVLAPAAGIITLAHPDMYYSGGTLILDHGQAVSTTFLHLSALLVDVGDEVEQGQVIGLVGATGRSTGPHLDWRMNVGKARVDPELLVTTEQFKALAQ